MELNVVVLKYYFSKKKNYGTYELMNALKIS